jgi:hypothetical protein
VLEYRALRKIFGHKRDEVTGDWRLQNEELYSSPNIILVIKSRRLRLVGHVARMEDKGRAYRVLVGRPEWNKPLGRPRRISGIILKWILDKWDGRHGLDWSGSGEG